MRCPQCGLWGLFLCVVATLAVANADASGQSNSTALRVGMPATFFHDLPPIFVRFATEPFGIVLRETTGLHGELVVSGDPFATARALCDRRLQLAVFHSFEFGWVKQQHPELRPLMIAVNAERPVSAHVLVRRDSNLTTFADLKGKEFSLPKRSREPCRLYIDHQCAGCGAKAFFGHVVHSANVETALDDLCHGKLQAVVVDAIGLAFYKDLKPGCFARLQVLAETEFPPAVVAYRDGGLAKATIDRMCAGMCAAHKTELGREMMKLWQITSFDPVPANYCDAVAACVRTYRCENH